eukprot:scaffold2751_cov344-Prasinococcus_capsulatus_cf.AAC.6
MQPRRRLRAAQAPAALSRDVWIGRARASATLVPRDVQRVTGCSSAMYIIYNVYTVTAVPRHAACDDMIP